MSRRPRRDLPPTVRMGLLMIGAAVVSACLYTATPAHGAALTVREQAATASGSGLVPAAFVLIVLMLVLIASLAWLLRAVNRKVQRLETIIVMQAFNDGRVSTDEAISMMGRIRTPGRPGE